MICEDTVTDDEKQLELEVEAEIESVLSRYSVAVELHDDDTSEEVALCCRAMRRGSDEDVLAHMVIQLPVLSRKDERVLLSSDAQNQCVSLAIVAMAKLLLIQEQTRPEFNPFGVGDIVEA